MLLKDLAPLTKSPSELYFAQYDEVRNLVPENFYDKPEEDMIKDFDSRKTTANLIFLGVDETRKQDGLAWKIYTGAPFFALDVTPKGCEEQHNGANAVISAMEAKGLSFFQSRVVMSFSADDGASLPLPSQLWNTPPLTPF